MPETKQIIEIGGVKMEVDTRHAKRIDELKIGSPVKVLVKSYGDTVNVHPGVVVGFEPFPSLPTIIVAYVVVNYSSAELKFAHINRETKNTEIIHSVDPTDLLVDKQKYADVFDREIEKKRRELQDMEEKKKFFLSEFGAYWERVEAPAVK